MLYKLYILLYFALNVYPAVRTFQWLQMYFPNINPVIYGVVFALLPLSSVMTFYSHRIPVKVKKVVDWIGGIFALLFMFSFVFWALIDLGKLIIKHTDHDSALFAKYGGIGVFVLSALIILWGFKNFLKLHVTHYSVKFKNGVGGHYHVVLLSDIHLGAVDSERRLKGIVRAVNLQKPDAVFIAGDIFNNNFGAITDPDHVCELIKSIKSRYGIYCCLGNHDAGDTYGEMAAFIERCGIRLLNDEFENVDDRFVVLGRIDPEPMGGFDADTIRCRLEELEKTHDYKLPVIVLDHNPKYIDEYDDKYELILCGHTHHGQMFPANLVTQAMYKVDYGYYRENPEAPAVIVSSGAGIWTMPFRLASVCEICSIDIT